MLPIAFKLPADRQARILFLGAHCDDIEIGMGGTLMQLAANLPDAELSFRILTRTAEREAESRTAIASLVGKTTDIEFADFRNSFFPSELDVIKEYLEAQKALEPDLIFTHYINDQHQDHRILSELTRNTFRDHLILEYEILKYDGDLGNPAMFVPMSSELLERKVDVLMSSFTSQLHRQWFTRDSFNSLARVRGVQCANEFAESFYVNKWVLDPSQ